MKSIIFDIDGTLTETKKVEDKCFMEAFEAVFGIDIRQQDWADLKNVTDWGITEEIILREWNREPTLEEYERMVEVFVGILQRERNHDLSQFKEVKGAKDFFDHIRYETDWNIGIATGSWEKSALIKLDAIGINPKNIAFSNSNHYKSREEITKHTIRQIQEKNPVSDSEIIYLGDGAWDYRTCMNLGIHFIGIDILKDEKLSKMGAKTVFSDYTNREAIIEVMKGMGK